MQFAVFCFFLLRAFLKPLRAFLRAFLKRLRRTGRREKAGGTIPRLFCFRFCSEAVKQNLRARALSCQLILHGSAPTRGHPAPTPPSGAVFPVFSARPLWLHVVYSPPFGGKEMQRHFSLVTSLWGQSVPVSSPLCPILGQNLLSACPDLGEPKFTFGGQFFSVFQP